MKMNVVVRVLYLYLFAMLGLVFMAVGGIKLIDLGLRALVFRQADALERLEAPPAPLFMTERAERVANDTTFSQQERELVRQSIRDYQQWQERRRQIDPVIARRQRTAANALALIIVGLPIYLYHWRLISAARRKTLPG